MAEEYDAGPGYPIITGEPSDQAKMGTPLDPDGHTAADTGSPLKESDPLHVDDPEQAGEVNKKSMEKGAAAIEAGETEEGTDKAVRGPKEAKK